MKDTFYMTIGRSRLLSWNMPGFIIR